MTEHLRQHDAQHPYVRKLIGRHRGQASISAVRLARSHPNAPIHSIVQAASACAVASEGRSPGDWHRLIKATGGGGI